MLPLDSLPRDERNRLDDRRLHNLLAREDTPGDRVGALGVVVCPQVAALVDRKVSDAGVTLDAADEGGEERGRDKELEVCLGSCGSASAPHGYRRRSETAKPCIVRLLR